MTKFVPILNSLRNMGKLYDKYSMPLCERSGISKSEMDVLAFLSNHPGMDTANDIVQLRMTPKANVSLAVESLIQKGLLSRAPDRTDRRRIHLSVSESAGDIISGIRKMQKGFFETLFAGLTDEEINTFRGCVEKLMANAGNALKGY